jgi:hypothetical protein
VKDLEPVGEHVEALLQRIGMPPVPDLARLVDQWTAITPEPWASAAAPVGLGDGVLVVEVNDGTHASLLSYQIGTLVERLEGELGAGVVTGVRIRVARRENPR